jgi:hypothetical protein
MMIEKWDERVAHIVVEVVAKQGYERSSVTNTVNPARSSVTNVDASSSGPNAEGTGDTCASPPPAPAAPSPSEDVEDTVPVDWATLTIIADDKEDGE